MAARPVLRHIRTWFLKSIAVLLIVTIGSVLLLRFLAPPVTTLMIERRTASWFGDGTYKRTPNGIPLDKTYPSMSAAVITAEDQNFPQHYGFDWKAIQRALDHN